MYPIAYAMKHKYGMVRAQSRSGGIFTALSDYIFDLNGVVYGCVMTDDNRAVHFRAMDCNERNKMRGSKYIQSDLNTTFLNVKKDLENGQYVLFSGTPCQIDGLKRYLNANFEKLITVDIVCHGVPSPLVLKKYVRWNETRSKSKVCSVNFRDKGRFGWKSHVETITFENKRQISSEVYKNIFYKHVALRPTCYSCPYKDMKRYSDISIADFWGIDTAVPGFSDDKGVSLVLINSDMGKWLFDVSCADMTICEVKIAQALQPPLIKPFSAPKNRQSFWSDMASLPFGTIVKKYGGMGSKREIIKSKIYRVSKIAVRYINECLPNKFKLTKSL